MLERRHLRIVPGWNRWDMICRLAKHSLTSVNPGTLLQDVMLRSKPTQNLIVSLVAEILRRVCPESTEGLRMTLAGFRMDANKKRR